MLSKYKESTDREFAPVCFNSTTKTGIGPKYNLDSSFQEVSNKIGNWISEMFGWIIWSIDAEYVNISIYSSFSGNAYIELPDKLRNSKKGLIEVQNNGNKCFSDCHIGHLNPLKINPDRITKADRRVINNLDYVDIKFPVSKEDYCQIEQKNNIWIYVFCYEIDLVYPVHVSDKKIEKCIDLLLITDEKSLERTKKDVCLKINGKYSVKLRSASIKFNTYFKQLAVPLKIYADLCDDEDNNPFYTKTYQEHIPCNISYKVVYIDQIHQIISSL